MDQSYIMQLLPLKAKAEHALSNGNFESAQSFIAEFADKLAAPYESGDKSYEAIRFAYLGASNAALVLGKILFSFTNEIISSVVISPSKQLLSPS